MSIQEGVEGLPPAGALMGLDPGSRTIGVAVSDGLRITATALETIKRRKFAQDAARLVEIADHRTIAGIVIGLPRNMDGSEGPRAQSARAFARNVAEKLGRPVVLWDERLTTAAAERTLLEADTSPKASRRGDRCAGSPVHSTGGAGSSGRHDEGQDMSDDIWRRAEIESPCIKVCVLHPDARICVGCYRTGDEIARWSRLGVEERRAVMEELPARASQLVKRRGGRRGRQGER